MSSLNATMKSNNSNMTILFRKRASPYTYAIFLSLLLFLQLSLSFYGENRKLLQWLQKMVLLDASSQKEALAFSILHDGEARIDASRMYMTNSIATHANDAAPPNHHSILMIHYHKTGFVLSRRLRSHSIEHFTRYIDQHYLSSGLNFTLPEHKSWGSFQQPRKFTETTHCPEYFRLDRGMIHVQESPDFYCGVEEMARILLHEEEFDMNGNFTDTSRIGTKIIHFVRNPYSMALSNYYYHAQVPTPEPWVKNHNPCKTEYFNDTTSLRDLLFPTLADESILSKESFDKVVQLCNSLYQTKTTLEKEKFEGHLHQLDPISGLKLSTAQMMIRGGGVTLMPGGDLLRMANNIIKLKQLKDYLKENTHKYRPLTVVALSMDDFITDPLAFTSSYLKILMGGNPLTLFENKPRKGEAIMKSIASKFAHNYNEMKSKEKHEHVTTGKHSDRQELMESLKNDELFGPILDAIEDLVNDALLHERVDDKAF
ncbi:hypothetical protein HJC23_005882 [Cyclotella cryptica]|uniref:Sulfotransferase n=1 Tax=Cyclotella cryptica TaxID=29204 RepID=A0ABD3QYV6_9STRA|eukprot:CCRYP_000415-RA/>CCRYP_000415-RA protein AED:0.03 eAED:0.03 QI:222/1/1/1/0/0/2/237/484